ncbi:MAG: 1-deoxy-D-xylulose-5-phosphate reductoisomerase [Deltaproteobacteria bacterium]|nr:1-deoxy-D-xylulose-5-phosphate reductoisomerase [Deltaproteobacteria bacterium]
MKTKIISILGSTGSIGRSTLDVIAGFPDRYRVCALAAGQNIEFLREQIKLFRPRLVAIRDENLVKKLKSELPAGVDVTILSGVEGYIQVATAEEADLVVSAMVGSAGLVPTFSAIKAGKNVALANKETLVSAGRLVMAEARKRNLTVFPIDSEHSAIYQSLAGQQRRDLRRIILTASGGPFRKMSAEELVKTTPEQALAHPNWTMGPKITIDSATLMNKGLEMIEARWLFDVPPEQIHVHVHPQSIIHSMVEYVDGSVIAQMGIPDMRVPIAYALAYPDRLPVPLPPLDFFSIDKLTFERPDPERFPCLRLAFEALAAGGTAPCVLNAANEMAVDAFLKKKIGFMDIPSMVESVLSRHSVGEINQIRDVLDADKWAREEARRMIEAL